jgi:hypothetical protein
MNAYEKLDNNHDKQEARDLAMLTALMGNSRVSTDDGFEMAWAFLERAAQFLKKKEAIREAEGRAYWDSPEGKARREEIRKRFEERKADRAGT